VRNSNVNYYALSELHRRGDVLPGATRLTLFGACPWLSYSAPSALAPLSYSAPSALSFVQRRPYDLFTDSLHLFYKFSLSLCLLIIDAPKLPTDNVESGSAGEPTGLNFETLGRIANA